MTKQTILVTGSSSGFGRLTVEMLARCGHTVFATMRDVNGRNAKTAARFRDLAMDIPGKLHVVEMDVSNEGSVREAVASAIAMSAGVDVVVNNAGLMAAGFGETFSDDRVRAVFEVNTFGPQRVDRAVLPHMRSRGKGLLIHVSSVFGRLSFPFHGVYAASKHALESLAECYHYELAPFGIESILVEPGGFPTEMFQKMVVGDDLARTASYGPLSEVPEKVYAGYIESMSGPDVPKPQAVADAIRALIEMPAGERPLRTVVDTLLGKYVESINTQVSPVQAEYLAVTGMKDIFNFKG
jgi:NAD(P)-dependent dehydrogenase (short-subunit alcohol dehydrogenase family)